MSLVYAAIMPHSPLLIPSVGKEHLSLLSKTSDAYQHVKEDLYVSKIETIVVISPHGPILNKAFSINLSPEFSGSLEQFGDFATKQRFSGDIGLAYQIRERLETRSPLQLVSEPKLDYGSFVPLHLVSEPLANLQIIPLYYASELSLEEHFNFGQLLKRELVLSGKRVAVIASGDLSHSLSQAAPGGYSPKAEKFDNKLVELLQKNKVKEILDLNPNLIQEANECGLKSIVMLLGILDGLNLTPERMSYEAPFGVGYLTMKYNL